MEWTEGVYLVGSGAGVDVRLQTEGVAEYHVSVEVGSEQVRVEDLAGGVSVNGKAVSNRVEAEMPASIELFGTKLVVEAVQRDVSVAEKMEMDPLDAPTMVVAFSPENGEGLAFPASFEGPLEGKETGAALGVREASTAVRYELRKELAQGGMGIVYVGCDAELERELAVKVSKLGIGEDPRFALEAKVLGQLAHPNIVPIHAMGTDEDGFPFYSMKLVKGRSLQNIIQGLRDEEEEVLKAFPLGRLMEVFRKVCDAMAFAHSKKVLHRDLKPDNVMVGEFGEVLVMDWGMAKFLGEPENIRDVPRRAGISGGDLGLTMEGEVLGTPKYMSPEQAEGDSANLDERSDVYALGAILYAILTHRAPIEATTLDELLMKVRTGVITPIQTERVKQGKAGGARDPETMERTIPKALQAVTLKAMHLDRENRYASVEALAAEIERYQNGFATRAENAGALRQLLLLIKRHKTVSGLVALLLIGVAGFVVRLEFEKKQAQASERRALASEQEAVASRQKAEAARETIRLEAARTAVTLAEASEQVGDLEGLERALGLVPEDLRDPTWKYLNRKVDACDVEFVAERKMEWRGVENHPTDSGLFLALQSDGLLCSLNPATGGVAPLWKAAVKGRFVEKMAISEDGQWLAIAFIKQGGVTHEVEVFESQTGKQVGASLTPPSSVFDLHVSQRNVLTTTMPVPGPTKTCCWDLQSGKQLWEKLKFRHPHFSKSGDEVMGFQPEGFVRVKVESGEPLVSPVKLVVGASDSYPNTIAYVDDGKFLYQSGPNMALVNTQENALRYALKTVEGQDFSDARAVAVSGKRGIRADALRTGENCVRFELRRAWDGFPLGTWLLKGRLPSSPDSDSSIRFNADAVALRVMGDKNRIRVWDLREAKPLFNTSLERPFASGMWLGEGDEGLVFSTSDGSKSWKDSKSWVVEKVDYHKAQRRGSGLSLLTVNGFWHPGGYLMASSSRSGDWIVFQGIKDSKVYLSAASIEAGIGREVWSRETTTRYPSFSAIHPTRDEVWLSGHLLNLKTGEEIRSLELPEIKARRVWARPTSHGAVWAGEDRVFEPVERVLGRDNIVRMLALWNVRTGKLEAEVDGPYASVLASSPDGATLLEGGDDKRLRVRNGRTLAVEADIRVHDQAVSGVAWHPTRPLVATASADGMIRIWDRRDWSKVEELRTEQRNRLDLSVSPNGRRLLGMVFGKEVRVYEPLSFRD